MILVSILGDFHSSILPILYNFKTDITKHLLLYDDAKKDIQNAQGINRGIKNFLKKSKFSFTQLNYKLDEDSLESLEKCAKYILTLTTDPTDIYINTTDGYSTLTTLLHHKLFKKGVHFIAYDMYDNQYNILNRDTLSKHDMQSNMNIEDHFLLKGYKVQKSTLKDFALKNSINIKKIFEKMSNEYDSFIKTDERIYPKISDLNSTCKRIKKVFIEMDEAFKNSSVSNAILTGGLFECYIYLLVKDMGYDDIELGLQVFQKYKNSDIKNEFDILIMKDNHLHMIECKYKNFVKMDELVYKYIALSNIIDEDGKMAIVTKKEPRYDASIDLHVSKGLTYKRGRLSNIYFYGNVRNNPTKFKKELAKLFQI